MTYNQILLIIYSAYLAFISIITYILFLVDKHFAEKENHQRIKEKTLLFFIVIGGSIGAYLGRITSHHKTLKKYFSFIINVTLILELITIGAMIALAIVG